MGLDIPDIEADNSRIQRVQTFQCGEVIAVRSESLTVGAGWGILPVVIYEVYT